MSPQTRHPCSNSTVRSHDRHIIYHITGKSPVYTITCSDLVLNFTLLAFMGPSQKASDAENFSIWCHHHSTQSNITCIVKESKQEILNRNETFVLSQGLSDSNRGQLTYLTHLPWTKTADVWQTTFSNAFSWIIFFGFFIRILLKFVPNDLIENKSALVQIMAWYRTGDKPLTEPVLSPVHWCIYAIIWWMNNGGLEIYVFETINCVWLSENKFFVQSVPWSIITDGNVPTPVILINE